MASYQVTHREGTVLSELEPVEVIEGDLVEMVGSDAKGVERQVLKAGFLNMCSCY